MINNGDHYGGTRCVEIRKTKKGFLWQIRRGDPDDQLGPLFEEACVIKKNSEKKMQRNATISWCYLLPITMSICCAAATKQ